jgi:2-polyprenyl-3-methyl-5-hydroxy-6-metoxy-1,4-benzoquinol methylase
MATHSSVYTPARVAEPHREPPDGFHIKAAALQPVRAAYARHIILEHLGLGPAGKRALVVGCGHGFLAGELARLGFAVAAVDLAAPAGKRPDVTNLGFGIKQG